MSVFHLFRQGLKAAWPICLGYLPIGGAFGVIAGNYGLSVAEIGLMSLLVFAGSSQFIAVSMLHAGAGLLPVVTTTFVVNLRHLLMSSALADRLGKVSRPLGALFAYGITDESFAVNTARFQDEDWDYGRALLVNHISNAAWIVSTMLGGAFGRFIPEGGLGIDYALTAMFLCLLVYQLRNRLHVLVAIVSGILAVLFALWLPGNAYVILASVPAAAAGAALRNTLAREKKGPPVEDPS
ncbi:MAG: AzlC family ABC transporter permease [Deltaproteobacteria bacterium]|nr:AzlC family ABC transporter permease [Deltaproteobacteria bacterium]MBW2009471.1 AzlC family ABC transporter permease [Deltaproteobacteria bacterium]MBW2347400.1 AzlC family ABC transporter permease [Deltaproteobacteria bacterium]